MTLSPTEPQYLTDETGRRIAVVVAVDRYREMLEALDELDAIRAYDEAKASGETPIPLNEALREVGLSEE